MYRIVRKEALKPTVILYEIEAPMVAKKAEPGQFIILRVDENGERIPITIHDFDREKGTVTIIVQTIGATTEKLSHKSEGEYIQDFVGPLGRPTETEGKKKVCVVGGGVGCAIAYPVLKKFHDCGAEVHAVVGFKSKDVVILEDKFKAVSSVLKVCTDDGSYGQKGMVTEALKELLDAGNVYDEIFAIGPMVMMKFVCKTTAPYNMPTTAWTSAPQSWNFFKTGYAMAQPTPPPTTQTFFLPSVSVGLPSGPTKSCRHSPCCLWLSFSVVAPTV